MPRYNPREPRPNPEVKEILDCIKRTHADLQRADTHTQRRGYARILKAHLEMLDGEPETFTDLQPGKVDWSRRLDGPDLRERARMTEESPFDTPGETNGDFFFYADGGYVSLLYRGEVVDPYQIPLMHRYGPWSSSLEKLYASAAPTTHHFTDPEMLRRFVGSKGNPHRQNQFWLLPDPRGLQGGGSMLLKTYATQGNAIKAADRLGEQLDIRFVVAVPRIAFLNR
ncbi:MAG: hypothetical protein KC800_03385 [Candidatus Eremiobacteraeota bacterium]|nr:hypothetical protein [Candidatus Eremiobacteraeota bacterium]